MPKFNSDGTAVAAGVAGSGFTCFVGGKVVAQDAGGNPAWLTNTKVVYQCGQTSTVLNGKLVPATVYSEPLQSGQPLRPNEGSWHLRTFDYATGLFEDLDVRGANYIIADGQGRWQANGPSGCFGSLGDLPGCTVRDGDGAFGVLAIKPNAQSGKGIVLHGRQVASGPLATDSACYGFSLTSADDAVFVGGTAQAGTVQTLKGQVFQQRSLMRTPKLIFALGHVLLAGYCDDIGPVIHDAVPALGPLMGWAPGNPAACFNFDVCAVNDVIRFAWSTTPGEEAQNIVFVDIPFSTSSWADLRIPPAKPPVGNLIFTEGDKNVSLKVESTGGPITQYRWEMDTAGNRLPVVSYEANPWLGTVAAGAHQFRALMVGPGGNVWTAWVPGTVHVAVTPTPVVVTPVAPPAPVQPTFPSLAPYPSGFLHGLQMFAGTLEVGDEGQPLRQQLDACVAKGWKLFRVDLQRQSEAGIKKLVAEFTRRSDAWPLWMARPEHLKFLPRYSWVENMVFKQLLEGSTGVFYSPSEYFENWKTSRTIAAEREFRMFALGGSDNLNKQWLATMGNYVKAFGPYWSGVEGVAIHRYPENNPLPDAFLPHDGFANRHDEVVELRKVIGSAPKILVTETGYHMAPIKSVFKLFGLIPIPFLSRTIPGLTQAQQLACFQTERAFWLGEGGIAALYYQRTDGPNAAIDKEEAFGVFDVNGNAKLSADLPTK